MFDKFWKAYEDDYKKLMIIPIVILILFSGVIIYTKLTTGEFFYKDISLKGGTSITFYTNKTISGIDSLIDSLLSSDADYVVISDSLGKFKGYEFRTTRELSIQESKDFLASLTNEIVNDNDFSVGIQSAGIASSFFNEFITIMIIAFVLMGVVALYYFKSPITALTTAFCTFVNLIVVIGVLNLLGEQLSIAGIGAILMLLGLSTDTDILLATNIIRNDRKDLKPRLRKMFYTELTICMAAITNALVIYLLTNISVIKSIALILLIGSIADLISTLFFSVGLMRLYVDWRGSK